MTTKTVFCKNENQFEKWINKLKANDPMDDLYICLCFLSHHNLQKNHLNKKKTKQKDFSNSEEKPIKNYEKNISEALKVNSTLKKITSFPFSQKQKKNFQFKLFHLKNEKLKILLKTMDL